MPSVTSLSTHALPPGPRVAHVVSLKNLGGVERYFMRFLTDYAHEHRLNIETLLTTRGVHPFLAPMLAPWRRHCLKGPGWWKWPNALGLRAGHQRRLIQRLDPDAVLVWNKLFGHPLPSLETVPLIHYEHGTAWMPHTGIDVGRYLARVSGVISVSHAARRVLELRWGLPRTTPSLTLHNAIDVPHAATVHDANRFRIGFAGRLKAIKAPIVALETLRALGDRVPHAELWFAGEGPLTHSLKAWAARWGLEKRVRFLGPLEDMSTFYNQLDALVCPSWREPFGLVVQEAIAHGIPALVANVDGLPEALGGTAHGAILEPTRPLSELAVYGEEFVQGPRQVYSPYHDDLLEARLMDPDAAADTLVAWAKDPDLRRRMGHRARAHLRLTSGMQRYGNALSDFIAQLAHERSRAPSLPRNA